MVRIPMRIKRHGSRKKIVVPGDEGDGTTAEVAAQEPLVVALARGHRFGDMIESWHYGRLKSDQEAVLDSPASRL